MEHIDVSNLSLATLGAEIFRLVIRTTDLKDPVFACMLMYPFSDYIQFCTREKQITHSEFPFHVNELLFTGLVVPSWRG